MASTQVLDFLRLRETSLATLAVLWGQRQHMAKLENGKLVPLRMV